MRIKQHTMCVVLLTPLFEDSRPYTKTVVATVRLSKQILDTPATPTLDRWRATLLQDRFLLDII